MMYTLGKAKYLMYSLKYTCMSQVLKVFKGYCYTFAVTNDFI